MLGLLGVTKRFEGRLALDNLDLELERGRSTALIGPSGCGKSTVLRLCLGLIAPDTGSVVSGRMKFNTPKRFVSRTSR